jgi:hypothetical protein
MGQAKKRGTFEQRRTEAFIREAEKHERARVELAQRRERQRQQELENPVPVTLPRRRVSHRSTMLAAALVGMSMMGISTPSPAKESK